MLRSILSKAVLVSRVATQSHVNRHIPVVTSVRGLRGFFDKESSGVPDEQYDEELYQLIQHEETTAEDLREIFTEIHHLDYIPEGKVCCAFLKSARKHNDFALAVRILESIKWKCGAPGNAMWPYLMQEMTPTMVELGIPTLEELNYDTPELWLQDTFDMH